MRKLVKPAPNFLHRGYELSEFVIDVGRQVMDRHDCSPFPRMMDGQLLCLSSFTVGPKHSPWWADAVIGCLAMLPSSGLRCFFRQFFLVLASSVIFETPFDL
jgi:hypothetical protein